MMTKEKAREFASRWLPAWTGNDPEKLADFYSDDALYLDPAVPGGIRGKDNLLAYFRKLLAQNPRVGGLILANVGIDEARAIMKKDPFTIHGASEYQFIEFTPGKYDERFACFVK